MIRLLRCSANSGVKGSALRPWNKGLRGAYHLSEETKRKISTAVSKSLTGHSVCESTRQKISKSKMGKPSWNKGRKGFTAKTEEAKLRCLEGLKVGRELNASTPFRKGMAPWNKGKKENLSEESRLKIVLAHKGRSPWNRGKHPYLERPETINKIREARLKQIFPVADTSIEIAMQKELKRRGIPFKTHYPILGQPDIFIEPNICIFCDGDYWHMLPKVRARDEKVTMQLEERGYRVLRFSEKAILDNIENCVARIEKEMPATFTITLS